MTNWNVFWLFIAESEAATKIQAVFRGHKVRASMKQGDTSSAKSKETSSASSANKNADDPAAREALQAEFREDDKGNTNKTHVIYRFQVDRIV